MGGFYVEHEVVQFDESDLQEPSEYCKDWTFTGAMISTCRPLFNFPHGLDNHDFEARLRKAKVLLKSNRTDTESCQFWAYFSSKKSGLNFIERLNKYLREKSAMLREVRAI